MAVEAISSLPGGSSGKARDARQIRKPDAYLGRICIAADVALLERVTVAFPVTAVARFPREPNNLGGVWWYSLGRIRILSSVEIKPQLTHYHSNLNSADTREP
jgi:hypothetical protein